VVVGLTLSALWLAGVFTPEATPAVETLDVTAVLSAPRTSLLASPDGANVGLAPGDYAPDFEFSEFSGRRVRLSDFRGSPVVINFWASWCSPCEAELPLLASALDSYASSGLSVVAVNHGESFRRASAFISDTGVTLTSVAFDPAHEIADAYGVRGLPVTGFIDSEGVITGWVRGQVDEAALSAGIAGAVLGWSSAPPGGDSGEVE
jgi:thiol-disulfide isomerase/thioredoxin